MYMLSATSSTLISQPHSAASRLLFDTLTQYRWLIRYLGAVYFSQLPRTVLPFLPAKSPTLPTAITSNTAKLFAMRLTLCSLPPESSTSISYPHSRHLPQPSPMISHLSRYLHVLPHLMVASPELVMTYWRRKLCHQSVTSRNSTYCQRELYHLPHPHRKNRPLQVIESRRHSCASLRQFQQVHTQLLPALTSC